MDNQNNNGGNQPQKPNIALWVMLILGSLLLAYIFYTSFFGNKNVERVKYTQFLEDLKDGKVKSIKLSDTRVMVVTLKGENQSSSTQTQQNPYAMMFLNQARDLNNSYETMLAEDMDTLMSRLEEYGVEGELVASSSNSYIIELLLTVVLPVILFWLLLGFLFRKMGGSGGPMGFGKSTAKVYVQKETGVTFKDVAGEDEARNRCRRLWTFCTIRPNIPRSVPVFRRVPFWWDLP
ncbi:MAG: ATP-dependent metallopeptidase FtsH/Yme1/Tma family protein, partial [Lachnospiraceae bacterium]|nr:ATP-dependent metallopeptidase FtsH/Yme1/Tma family protein [Lachnospiraceae bacterium]